jgi:hypothetical protein
MLTPFLESLSEPRTRRAAAARLSSAGSMLLVALAMACCSTDPPSVQDCAVRDLGPLSAFATARDFHGYTLSPNMDLVKPDWVYCQELDDLTEDQQRTLLSIWQVRDTNLFLMTYYGDIPAYDDTSWQTIIGTSAPTAGAAPAPRACSAFSATNPAREPLFGYNNDEAVYEHNTIVFTRPEQRMASVSMAMERYAHLDRYSRNPNDRALRDHVLKFPLYTFDGMNEHGVVMAPMSNVDEDDLTWYQPFRVADRPSLFVLTVIRYVLDQAHDVFEAIDLLGQVNNMGGYCTHYLVADALGNSAIFEYRHGELVVIWREGPFQIATNNRVEGHQNDLDYWSAFTGDRRYVRYFSLLTESGGVVSEDEAFDLLRANSASVTLWSSVFNAAAGDWHLVWDRRWSTVYRISPPPAPVSSTAGPFRNLRN